MTAAIVIFSFIAFAFSSIVMMPGVKGPLFGSPQAPINIAHVSYAPPERRAIIVDNDGLAHSTADLTHATKRDRSRVKRSFGGRTPSLNIVSGEVPLGTVQGEVGPAEMVLQAHAPAAARESAIMSDITQEER